MIGALNGLYGDALEREGSALAAPMSVRVDGRPVALEPDALAAAFPAARARLVVFVHGLMETEHGWQLGARTAAATARAWRATSASRRCTSATTPAATSPRTAASLAELLDELVAAWPVAGRARSRSSGTRWAAWSRAAPATSAAEGAAWSGRVRHVVSLGTPHMGAPLEQGVHYAERSAQRAARDAAVRRLPAPPQRGHPRPAPRLARRRGLARTATPTPCAPRPAPRCRCSRARRTASSRRRSRATRATRSGG